VRMAVLIGTFRVTRGGGWPGRERPGHPMT
jgi:hypothetical protein